LGYSPSLSHYMEVLILAATVTIKDKFKLGNGFVVIADVAFDNSYPTGGEEVLPEKFGINALDFVQAAPSSGYVFQYDHTNKKLLAYYADYDAVADGALIQVPDTTNLSAIITRVMAIGR